jgi:hypothetical protein
MKFIPIELMAPRIFMIKKRKIGTIQEIIRSERALKRFVQYCANTTHKSQNGLIQPNSTNLLAVWAGSRTVIVHWNQTRADFGRFRGTRKKNRSSRGPQPLDLRHRYQDRPVEGIQV